MTFPSALPLVAILIAFACLTLQATGILQGDLDKAYVEEIKEYHFHIYFFKENPQSNRSAETLANKIKELAKAGFFSPVVNRVILKPTGPHMISNYEVWCPKEHFSRTYSWFLLHRGNHSVLIHPLTKEEIKDYTERAVWLGPPMPLNLAVLSAKRDRVPLQNPELKLGYSAPAGRRQ